MYTKSTAIGLSEQLLTDLRKTVSELRRSNPELRNCSLADMAAPGPAKRSMPTLLFERSIELTLRGFLI